jgi:hypothetical protein
MRKLIMGIRSKTDWVIEIDVIGQLLPHPKEGWLRIVVNPDVARELFDDLDIVLRRKRGG